MNRIHAVLGFLFLASTFACSAAVDNTGDESSDLQTTKPSAELTASEVVISATETSQDAPKVTGLTTPGTSQDAPKVVGFGKMKPRADLGGDLGVSSDPGAPVEQLGAVNQRGF